MAFTISNWWTEKEGILGHEVMKKYRVYTNSKGNYYHDEIAGLVSHALSSFAPVELCDEQSGFTDEDWHIIIAPHEFFAIGKGKDLIESLPDKLIYITTEQSHSPWFEKSIPLLYKAAVIWDLDLETAEKLRSYHQHVYHMPLGWEKEYLHFQKINKIPTNPSYFFGHEVNSSNSSLFAQYEQRPIDVFFIGAHTPRREQLIAALAEDLSDLKCCFLIQNGARPLRPGVNTTLDSNMVCALEQRSKIVLNLHRDDEKYFESHRLIYHSVAQGGLAISEPLTAQGAVESIPIVETLKESMGSVIRYYLTDAGGIGKASRLAQKQFEVMVKTRSMSKTLQKLADILPR